MKNEEKEVVSFVSRTKEASREGRLTEDGSLERLPLIGSGEEVWSGHRTEEGQLRIEARASEKKQSRLTALDLLRDTEIRDLDPTLVIDENVGSLDISMNNPSVVKIDESLKRLSNERPNESLLERSVVSEQS